MGRDPFGFQQALIGLAVGILAISLCLNWAAHLIAEALPVLTGMAITALIITIAWKLHVFRRDRW